MIRGFSRFIPEDTRVLGIAVQNAICRLITMHCFPALIAMRTIRLRWIMVTGRQTATSITALPVLPAIRPAGKRAASITARQLFLLPAATQKRIANYAISILLRSQQRTANRAIKKNMIRPRRRFIRRPEFQMHANPAITRQRGNPPPSTMFRRGMNWLAVIPG